jgi:hypothetical protein
MAQIDVEAADHTSIMARVTPNTVAAALIMFGTAIGSIAAIAQPTPPGATSRPGHLIEAPVGHRQPTAQDLPRNVEQSEGKATKREKDFDRKIDSICRGC